MTAGGTRPLGSVTRGTTRPNRLRRFDRWIVHRLGRELARVHDPLVVDLGFGASAVTTLELAGRLSGAAGRSVEVLGLDVDPARVAQAVPLAGGAVSFAVGGFEVPAARRPLVIRAANVLRQYSQDEVSAAWARMVARLAPAGIVVEGTCDELGRRCAWVTLAAGPTVPGAGAVPGRASDAPAGGTAARRTPAGTGALVAAVPEALTIALDLRSLARPSEAAARLPKALIHHNVPGEPIHELFADLDGAWQRAAGHGVFGPRQRWVATCAATRAAGWPVRDGPARWRLGELTVAWSAVAPRSADR